MATAPRHETDEHAHEAPAKPEAKKPEHPARSGLIGALRNSGMTHDQAEGVVKALEEYLVAGSKH